MTNKPFDKLRVNKQTNKQTNKPFDSLRSLRAGKPLRCKPFLSKIPRAVLLLVIIGAGSTVGGMLSERFFKPKEACAACAALPQQGSAVYACPRQGCIGSHCIGQLSTTETTCSYSYTDPNSNRSCGSTGRANCTFVGYLIK
mgnify:CR=1 FL=1